jgi:hypothetical protein
MARTKISEFSSTPGSNTDIDGINIAEGCAPSGINDAIRELMSQLKDFQAGTAGDSFNGPVGTSTAAAGAFTTLTASSTATLNTLASSGATLTGGSINNMAIGGTTAAAASVTTLTTSSTVTHNGGTANGVAYLNGSKVLTTGSALTFDGTTLSNTGSGDRAKFGTGTRNIYIAGDSGGVSLLDGAGQTGNGWYINGLSNYVAGYIGSSEKMRLTSTGLGIGTSSPTNTLSVSGSANITGNTTLGDATTDTVTVNGYMGVGGAATSNVGLYLTSSALSSASQYGVFLTPTSTSAATTTTTTLYTKASTAAAAYTSAAVRAIHIADATKGAGSTITDQQGLYIADQTQGTNNYGITSLVSSGTNKWNIYASGTAQNYFAGNVGIGVAPSVAKFDLSFSDAATYSSSNMATGLAGYVVNSSATDSTSATLLFACNGTSTDAQGAISLVHTGTGLGALAFGTRAAGNVIERLRIDSSGNVQVQTGAIVVYAPAPASISTTATLTNANIQAQIINTTGTTYTVTMPLGTTLETMVSWAATDLGYNFTVINTASGTITMAVNTGVTSLGALTITTGTSANFRIRRTAANTFVLYRLS